MSSATTGRHWTVDEYLAWETAEPLKYELVDGEVRAMVGGTESHDTICNNLRRELGNLLRGRRCRAQGPDMKLRAGDNVRYPDAYIDCGPRSPGGQFAQEPVAVFEVLSRSTAWIDQTRKLRDYDRIASIVSYALISQDEPRALIYRRSATGRLDVLDAALLETLEAEIELPEADITLPMSALYEGVTFDPAD